MHNLTRKYLSKISVLIITLLLPSFISAQNIVGTAKNGTSLDLNPSNSETVVPRAGDNESFDLGMLSFSTAEKKVELNYYSYFNPENFTHFFIGISASGELKNSLATIFKNDNIVAGGSANFRTGFRLWKPNIDFSPINDTSDEEVQKFLDALPPAKELWLVANAGYNGSSFKLFSQDSTFSKQVHKKNFSAGEVNIGLNYWCANILSNNVLAGATIGVKKRNNFDDLTEHTREDTRTIIDTATGTNRKVNLKETVFIGDYKEETIYPLNFDIYFVPHKLENNVAFLVNSTTNISSSAVPQTSIGFGVFALKNRRAFNPWAGIIIGFSDVFNNDKSDDDKGNSKKINIAISTRINIVNNNRRVY